MTVDAYALGWSTTPGPPEVGAALALQLTEAGDGPARFRLGALDGEWATFFARRLAVHAKADEAVQEAWQAYAATMDTTRVRAALEYDPDDPTLRLDCRDVGRSILTTGGPDERQAVIDVLADHLRTAHAEGRAAAAVLQSHGVTAPLREKAPPVADDWTVEFDQAWDALAGNAASGSFLDDATGWMGRVVSGASGDLGQAMAGVIRDGGGYNDLLDAVDELTGDDVDSAAVKFFTDLAVSQSLSNGALDLYSAEGITKIDYMTAGDERVCEMCLNAEGGNPWDASEVPRPGLHGSCRCCIAASPPTLT